MTIDSAGCGQPWFDRENTAMRAALRQSDNGRRYHHSADNGERNRPFGHRPSYGQLATSEVCALYTFCIGTFIAGQGQSAS